MNKKIIWITLIVLNIGLIIYFWYSNSSYLINNEQPGDIFIALGRITGLLSAYLILIQLFLISRFSVIEREYGFDKLNAIHRWIGSFLGVFIISHPLFLTIGYAGINKISYFHQFLNFQTSWENVFGATLAFGIIIFTAIISTNKIRRKIPYEFWYFSHLPLYIAIVIAFGHQTETGDLSSGGAMFYWYFINAITIGVLISYRFLKPAYLFFKHHFIIEKIIKENESVYSVYISGKKMSDYKFLSGQYASLIFLQKNMWFHHPFSYSDSPNGNTIRFSIKASGDFTSKIGSLKLGSRVWIDGPLGTFTLKKSVKDKYLFIAGGIGITPILSIIKSIPEKNNAMLLYSNETEEKSVFGEELNKTGVKTYNFFTGGNEKNKIDIEKINNLCPDFTERDIYICGPGKMIRSIVESLRNKNVPLEQIHFEKFSY
jgi:predicted ferric reductase